MQVVVHLNNEAVGRRDCDSGAVGIFDDELPGRPRYRERLKGDALSRGAEAIPAGAMRRSFVVGGHQVMIGLAFDVRWSRWRHDVDADMVNDRGVAGNDLVSGDESITGDRGVN